MLLQYEELLLMRRHPDYRPLSLNCNHKLLPHSASVRLCVCTGNRGQGAEDMNGKQDGALFSISSKCSQWCQYNRDKHNPSHFIFPLHSCSSLSVSPCVVRHMTCHLFLHPIYTTLLLHPFSPLFSFPDMRPNAARCHPVHVG